MTNARGSQWSRWDLHVHTPASIYHNYGGQDDTVWERYITALEALPTEFQVLGINDYLFLDGYQRVLEYKAKGRLQNIKALFPVVEFRLDHFAGTDGNLKRINYHVIFSDDLTVSQIEAQFLNRIDVNYELAPGGAATWSGGIITRSALEEFGQQIIASAPEGRRHEYSNALLEGFRNLNLSLRLIKDILKGATGFEGKYLTAVGKTEWASLKWSDQSVAEKKHLINSADIVFVASENAAAYQRAKETLQHQGVNDRLLDCSDAHTWADSKDKDALGKCDLWVKADPTFRGLQHAMLEFDERIFVGSEPPKLIEVRNKPSKYIRSVAVRKKANSSFGETWFHSNVPLNHGLVAIVGNKGSGKSALADIIALGGNSSQQENFSFLTTRKFRNPKEDKSAHFVAELTWESNDVREYELSSRFLSEQLERVRYIPQSYLERLCNEFATEKASAFDRELRAVIFSHIPAAERLGKEDLDALLSYQGEETYERIAGLKTELSKVNREISALEEQGASERKRELENRLTARLKELAGLKAAEPKAVPKPDADEATKIQTEELQTRIQEERLTTTTLEKRVIQTQEERKVLLSRIATIDKVLRRIANLEESHRRTERESLEDLAQLDVVWTDLVTFSTNTAQLKRRLEKYAEEEAQARGALDTESEASVAKELGAARERIAALQAQLDVPTRRYQEYLTAHKEWQDAVLRMEKNPDEVDSIASLQGKLDAITKIPADLAELESKRNSLATEIHGQLLELGEQYRRLYRPVQEFIEQHEALASRIQLSFDVSIQDKNFATEIFDWINRARAGSFQGTDDGAARVRDLLQRHDFNNKEGLLAFLAEFAGALRNDLRHEKPRPTSPQTQLRNNKSLSSFYDYVYGIEYLAPRFLLKMDGKELHELSPGERGLLLLLFYLLVEKSETPLILDQPEENLDNETVHQVLVPSIQLAKRRRQIIVVTHNPNLAVVADADQVIVATIDKKGNNRVDYASGALENPNVNGSVVRYLEGTLPAFIKRDKRYFREKIRIPT